MFLQRNKKRSVEIKPEKEKPKLSNWFKAESYYKDLEEQKRLEDCDYKAFKNNKF